MHLNQWLKKVVIFIPVAIGIAVVVLAPRLKSPPQKNRVTELAAKVRFIKPLHQDVNPKALGYGTSELMKSRETVAEVARCIVWVSEDLKEGNIISNS